MTVTGGLDEWQDFGWHGRRVAWRQAGSGPALVFCHGTPWSSQVWRDIAAELAADHSVYLWDMPGYGRSSMDPAHPVDLDVQGRTFAALLQHWRLDRPVVVAHDIGGAVALRAHLLHQRDVDHLILADIVTLRPWGSAFFSLVHDHASVFAQLPPALHRALVGAYIAGASHMPLSADRTEALLEPWLTRAGQAAFYAQIAQADVRHTDEVVDRLGQVRCPTTVLWGEHDAWIPMEQAHLLAQALPAARLAIIPNAGHLVQYDATAPLLTEIRAALQPS
jgi:pimeloyl-ACP methyl ester carboxylesterase